MASQYPGRGAALGLGVEGTWGTFEAAGEWIRIISSDLRKVRSRQVRNHLLGQSIPNALAMYVENELVTGSFVTEAQYHELAFLLEWAMGASATTGAGPTYTHTQTLASEMPFGLSLDLVRGTGGTSDKFEGCMCSGFSLSMSAGGGPMTATYNVIGQTNTSRTSVSTPTFSSVDAPVLYHQVDGDFTFNSVGYKLIDWTLNVDNALGPRIRYGSLNTLEPKRTGLMSVTSTVTLEVEDALVQAHIAGTQSDYTLNLAGSSPYDMAITGHNCIVVDVSDPVNSQGILTQTVTLRHLSDGTDHGLAIAIVNNEADNRTIENS